MATFEVLKEIVHHSIIKVLTTQMGVTSCCFHFKNSFFNCEKRDIKGSTSKIKDQHILFVSLLIKTVCNCRGCWLVDDTKHIQSRNCSRILRCLTL
mmetsp:Transcript_7233/g.8240  ORF Transcript_7233/g.8240 Transcript_7233/m.8240 type:complete len:96 (+) Transcript_7233:24-311(+)